MLKERQFSQNAPEYLAEVIARYGTEESHVLDGRFYYLLSMPISHVVDMYRYIRYLIVSDYPDWVSLLCIKEELIAVMGVKFNEDFGEVLP